MQRTALCIIVLASSIPSITLPGTIRQAAAQASPQLKGTPWRRALESMALGMIAKGDSQVRSGDKNAALPNYLSSSELWKLVLSKEPADSELLRNSAVTYEKIGDIRLLEGSVTEARDLFQKSQAIMERLSDVNHDNVDWQLDRVSILFHLAVVERLSSSERTGDAVNLYAQFLRLDPSASESDAAISAQLAGDLFRFAAKGDSALAGLTDALAIVRRLDEAHTLKAGQKYWSAILEAGLKALHG